MDKRPLSKARRRAHPPFVPQTPPHPVLLQEPTEEDLGFLLRKPALFPVAQREDSLDAVLRMAAALERPWDIVGIPADPSEVRRWLAHPHCRIAPVWTSTNALPLAYGGGVPACPLSPCSSCPLSPAGCSHHLFVRKVAVFREGVPTSGLEALRLGFLRGGFWPCAPIPSSLLVFPWLWKVMDLLPFAFPVSLSPLSCFVFTPSHQPSPPFRMERDPEGVTYWTDEGYLRLTAQDVESWLPREALKAGWEIGAWLTGRVVLGGVFLLEPSDRHYPGMLKRLSRFSRRGRAKIRQERNCWECPVMPDCFRGNFDCDTVIETVKSVYLNRLEIGGRVEEWCRNKGLLQTGRRGDPW